MARSIKMQSITRDSSEFRPRLNRVPVAKTPENYLAWVCSHLWLGQAVFKEDAQSKADSYQAKENYK